MKRRINVIINKLVWRFFPATRCIHFRTPDDIVTAVYTVDENEVFFAWLKNPTKYDPSIEKQTFRGVGIKGFSVSLSFYTTDSIDKFILKLQEVRQYIVDEHMRNIIENGGELIWEHKSTEVPKEEGYEVRKYHVSFTYPFNKTKPQ